LPKLLTNIKWLTFLRNGVCLYLVPLWKYSAPNNGATLKSGLGVVQGHWKWYTIRKLGYGFLLVFHSNYGRIFGRFDTIYERDGRTDAARRRRPRLRIIAWNGKGFSGVSAYQSEAAVKAAWSALDAETEIKPRSRLTDVDPTITVAQRAENYPIRMRHAIQPEPHLAGFG